MIELAVPVIAYGMGDRRVGHRQEAVVVDGAADVDADGLAAQARRRDAGVFQRLPSQFERHPLLRIDVVGLHLRQREELGVEALDVGQVATAGAGLGDPLGDPRLAEEFLPAPLRQIGDGVAALEQRLPRLVGVFMSPGKRVDDAHDRDVDVLGRPSRDQSSSSTVVVLDLGLALDDDASPATRWSDAGTRRSTVSVTPVRSSMSVAIATASRDDRPSSTIGDRVVDRVGRLAGGVARSSCAATGASRGPSCRSLLRRRCVRQLRRELDLVARVASSRASASSCVSHWFLWSQSCEFASAKSLVGEAFAPCRCAGCRPDRRCGRRGGRSCRSTCAGSRRPASAARRAR